MYDHFPLFRCTPNVNEQGKQPPQKQFLSESKEGFLDPSCPLLALSSLVVTFLNDLNISVRQFQISVVGACWPGHQ